MCFRPSTMDVKKKCPKCGFENEQSQKICVECETELPENALDKLAALGAPGVPGAPSVPGVPKAPSVPSAPGVVPAAPIAPQAATARTVPPKHVGA